MTSDRPAQTSIGESFAALEAEAIWFIGQGYSVVEVAEILDEPPEFVAHCTDPKYETCIWFYWYCDKWCIKHEVVQMPLLTPQEIYARAKPSIGLLLTDRVD